MKVEMDMPEIEGHEYTGEYRRPNNGEPVLTFRGSVATVAISNGNEIHSYPILRKAQRWRPATVNDLRENSDEFLDARFRDAAEKPWVYAKLAGADFRRPTMTWIADVVSGCFVICEVKA